MRCTTGCAYPKLYRSAKRSLNELPHRSLWALYRAQRGVGRSADAAIDAVAVAIGRRPPTSSVTSQLALPARSEVIGRQVHDDPETSTSVLTREGSVTTAPRFY